MSDLISRLCVGLALTLIFVFVDDPSVLYISTMFILLLSKDTK